MKYIPNKQVLAIILWFVIILSGVVINRIVNQMSPPQKNVWYATTDLPKNHQVKLNDLKPLENVRDNSLPPSVNEYLGKYLLTPIAKNGVLTLEALSDFPSIEIENSNYVVYTYPLVGDETFLAKVLNVMDTVQLCAVFLEKATKDERVTKSDLQTNCLEESLEVIAVYDGTGSSLSSWLAIKVPVDQVVVLGHLLAADKRFLLVYRDRGKPGAKPPTATPQSQP